MIVPQYWAEARRQGRPGGKQITVRRFGWSDSSESEARAMADSRAEQAFQQVISGVSTPRRERKAPYNGAEGVPIREEVVARHGDVVVTRNAYGARCLNTPDVVFADVDFSAGGSIKLKFALFGLLALFSIVAAGQFHSRLLGVALCIGSALVAASLGDLIHRTWLRAVGGPERLAQRRLEAFLSRHPAWNVRLYRTPAGLRLLATHAPASPHDPLVQEFFNALGVDPIYARMCRNQNCFRARLTAKPWRIGIQAHMRPRPGVWPVRPERLAERASWIAEYERQAAAFAACKFVESLGSGSTHPKVARIVALHDSECRANVSGLTMA